MRHHYFDDVKVGDSTARFLTEIRELVDLRDRLLGDYEQARDLSQRPRSRSTRWLASRPGDPMTQPPGWVPEPHW